MRNNQKSNLYEVQVPVKKLAVYHIRAKNARQAIRLAKHNFGEPVAEVIGSRSSAKLIGGGE